MKLLLDECVPRVLCADFPGHYCRTVSQMQWRGVSNGALLARAAQEGFEVFLTVDRNLRHQQNVKKLPIAVVVVHVRNNEYDEVRPFVPRIEEVLARIQRGALVVIE
jgi:predicted nuclease of predicted toxin-antitoxin system